MRDREVMAKFKAAANLTDKDILELTQWGGAKLGSIMAPKVEIKASSVLLKSSDRKPKKKNTREKSAPKVQDIPKDNKEFDIQAFKSFRSWYKAGLVLTDSVRLVQSKISSISE
jgi:hypothetical protein